MAIKVNDVTLRNLPEQVAENKSNIETLQSDVSTIQVDVEQVEKNKENIEALQTTTSEIESNVANVSSQVNTNTTNIATNSTNISNVASQVAQIYVDEEQIELNKTNIEALQSLTAGLSRNESEQTTTVADALVDASGNVYYPEIDLTNASGVYWQETAGITMLAKSLKRVGHTMHLFVVFQFDEDVITSTSSQVLFLYLLPYSNKGYLNPSYVNGGKLIASESTNNAHYGYYFHNVMSCSNSTLLLDNTYYMACGSVWGSYYVFLPKGSPDYNEVFCINMQWEVINDFPSTDCITFATNSNYYSVSVGSTLSTGVSSYSANTTTITYSSSDESIATIDSSGVITGVAVGECTLYATRGTATSSIVCKVTE